MSLVVRKYDASQRRQTKRERFIYEPIRDLQDIFQFRYALKFLVGTKLRVLYQRSFLGFLWVLLNPLLNLTVTALVFSVLMNRPIKTFTIYLFSGLIPWQFFRSTLKQGSRSIISNQGLIRKILVPKLIFPLADLGNNLVNMVFSMVAMFLLLQFIGASIHPQLVLLPIAMLFFMGFTFGITLILMVLMTYYRDIQPVSYTHLTLPTN